MAVYADKHEAVPSSQLFLYHLLSLQQRHIRPNNKDKIAEFSLDSHEAVHMFYIWCFVCLLIWRYVMINVRPKDLSPRPSISRTRALLIFAEANVGCYVRLNCTFCLLCWLLCKIELHFLSIITPYCCATNFIFASLQRQCLSITIVSLCLESSIISEKARLSKHFLYLKFFFLGLSTVTLYILSGYIHQCSTRSQCERLSSWTL